MENTLKWTKVKGERHYVTTLIDDTEVMLKGVDDLFFVYLNGKQHPRAAYFTRLSDGKAAIQNAQDRLARKLAG